MVWLAASVLAREFGSTGELYAELARSRRHTLVYVYSAGCQWCRRLDPHFERLPALFGGDEGGSAVAFARIDGRKSRNFARDFNVESYPQLLLFGSGGSAARPQDLLEAVYHGAKDFRAIAHFVGETTGEMPRWPQARDNVCELADASSLQELERQLAGDPPAADAVVVLFFVNPYMCSRHRELLLEESPNCAIERLSLAWGSKVRLWRIDSSQERWAALANEFRVSAAPSVFAMSPAAGPVVAVELRDYDRQVWGQELELLSGLLSAAVEGDREALEAAARHHHSVNLYDSLPERQRQVEEWHGERGDEEQEDLSVTELTDRICFM